MNLTWSSFVNKLWRDRRGQDLIEYAMLAGFIAVAVAAFFPTDVAPNISKIFSKCVNFLSQVP